MTSEAKMQSDRTNWTYAEWLELPDDGYRYELFGGILVRESSPTYRHQSIAMILANAVYNHLGDEQQLGWLAAPFGVKLANDTVFQPDLLYVRPDRRALIGTRSVLGAPDLVCEILSPSTEKRDFGDKRALYAQHAVQEYWIVDPEARAVIVHTNPAQNGYSSTDVYPIDSTMRSPLLNFALPVKRLFPTL